MRNVTVGVITFILLFALTASPAAAQGQIETITFPVEGMVCPFCAASVERVVSGLEGVKSIEADFVRGVATVEYNPSLVSPSEMVAAINSQTFYRARLTGENMATAVLFVPDLLGEPGRGHIEAAFADVGGVREISGESGRFTVEFEPHRLTPGDLAQGFRERTGMEVTILSAHVPDSDNKQLSVRDLLRYALWGAAVLAILWGGWRFAASRLELPSLGGGRGAS